MLNALPVARRVGDRACCRAIVPRPQRSQLPVFARALATWLLLSSSAARSALAQPQKGYMGGCMSQEVGDAIILYGFLFVLLVWGVASILYGRTRRTHLGHRHGAGPRVLQWFVELAGLGRKRRGPDNSGWSDEP